MLDPVAALRAAVDRLAGVTGVEGTVIASPDGLVMYSDLPKDPRRVAAMAAVLVRTAQGAVSELERGTYEMTIVQSDEGKVLCSMAGNDAILAVLVSARANLGFVLLKIREVIVHVDEAVRSV